MGEYEKARADYRRALKRDPLLQVAYYNRGNDWLLLKSYRKARRDLSRAIDLNRHDADAWNNRGVAFENLGKIPAASRDFQTALSLRPGFRQAADNLEKLKSLRQAEDRGAISDDRPHHQD